jgi:predicted MFS family arabinose efflux permease
LTQFGLLLALQFAFGIAASTFLLLPKILAVYMHAGPGGIGVVSAVSAFAGVASVPFLGARVDRAGRPRLLAFASLLMTATALAFAAVDRVGALAVGLRALQGIAATIVVVVSAALAADLAPPGAMARTLAIHGSAGLVTNAVAPLLAEPLIDRFGPRAGYVVAAVGALAALALSRRLVEKPHPADATSAVGLGPVARRGRAQRLMAVFALVGIAWGTMFTFSQPFALALGIQEVRGFFVAYTAAVLVVRFLLRDLIDRVGPERATVGGLGLYAVIVFSMRFLGMGPLTLSVMGGLYGVAHGMLFPAMLALGVAGLPRVERGRMLTLAHGAFIGGTALVAPLGPLAAHVGYPMVFAVAASGALAGVALVGAPKLAGTCGTVSSVKNPSLRREAP